MCENQESGRNRTDNPVAFHPKRKEHRAMERVIKAAVWRREFLAATGGRRIVMRLSRYGFIFRPRPLHKSRRTTWLHQVTDRHLRKLRDRARANVARSNALWGSAHLGLSRLGDIEAEAARRGDSPESVRRMPASVRTTPRARQGRTTRRTRSSRSASSDDPSGSSDPPPARSLPRLLADVAGSGIGAVVFV